MADWISRQMFERKQTPSFDLAGFARHVQEQANCMDQCGWVEEAGDLRKWASEMREKCREVNNQFEDLYGKRR